MLHKTNCTKCLIPYWLESADAIMKKVFRNFFAPRDISVVFLWSALERFLSLCLSASINVCAWILTSVCFFFTCVFCLKVWVFPSDSYEVTRRPPPRNVTVSQDTLAATCVLHYFSVRSQRSRFHTHIKSFSRSQAAVDCIRCTTLEERREEMHRSDFTPKSRGKN